MKIYLLILCLMIELWLCEDTKPTTYNGYDIIFKLNLFFVDIYSSTNYALGNNLENSFVVVIHGEVKKGKTFIYNLLLGSNYPSETSYSTVGLSMSKHELDGRTAWAIDTEGSNEVRSEAKQQHLLDRVMEDTISRLPGEHLLVFGEVCASNQRKLQEFAMNTKANRIIEVYNLMHKDKPSDYVNTFAAIPGKPSTIQTVKCDDKEVKVIFKKSSIKRMFSNNGVQILSYVLMNHDSKFGKCINDATINEIKSLITKLGEEVLFEPLLSFTEALNSSLIHNTNIDTAKFERNTTLLQPASLNMNSEIVNEIVDEKTNLISMFFKSLYMTYQEKKSEVAEHVRIGRINITGSSFRDGIEVDEPIVVSSASSLPHTFSENSTTILIRIHCPGFERNKTLKVIPIHDNKGGVKLILDGNEDEMGMKKIYSNVEQFYGKKLFMSEMGNRGFTYCHNLTLYEDGILKLYWRLDGMSCTHLW